MIEWMDHTHRAQSIGLPWDDYLSLVRADTRLGAWPTIATEGAVARLKRWLDAGRPEADPETVNFYGADEVRAIVVDVLRAVPAAARWHGCRHVWWFEVGRRTRGWQALAPTLRAPAGDSPHVINLLGTTIREELAFVVAHELAHSWHRLIHPWVPVTSVSERERLAGLLAVERGDDGDESEALARLTQRRDAREALADATALCWGFARPTREKDPGSCE